MPGKVNPVLCEAVNQVAARVFGNDHTVAYGASQGILELNTYLPVMADALFESGTLLANVCRLFAERCVVGIEADEERCRSYAERSSAIATALNPIIGYARAADLVHRSLDERRSIIDLVIEEGILDEEEARHTLDPIHLTHPT
jgi:fumarate hydratase class II